VQSVGLTFTDIDSARVKVAAATKEQMQSQVKYLQFGLNEGRLNNQLRSLDGAMRWAKALNRTLFVPTTCLRYKEGESSGYQRCAPTPACWWTLDITSWEDSSTPPPPVGRVNLVFQSWTLPENACLGQH
jgi:hypothetical protein